MRRAKRARAQMNDRNPVPKLGTQFRSLFSVGAMGAMSDRDLLDHFAHGGEGAEPAFAVLVDRHGPMIMRVCRNLLGDCDLAADSFQVTFLLLARRAQSIHDPDAARRLAASRGPSGRPARPGRRRAKETQGTIPVRRDPVAADDPLERDEGRAIVHEEIDRLDDGLRCQSCFVPRRGSHTKRRPHGCDGRSGP